MLEKRSRRVELALYVPCLLGWQRVCWVLPSSCIVDLDLTVCVCACV